MGQPSWRAATLDQSQHTLFYRGRYRRRFIQSWVAILRYSYTAALKGAKYLYSKETLPRRLGATITPALLQTMNPVLLPTIRVWRNKDGYSGVNLQR